MLQHFQPNKRGGSSCTRAVACMRRTEALASVKFYQILSIFFIRLIILEDFIRLISYNGLCVRLGCSFFLATALCTQASKCEISLVVYSCVLYLTMFRLKSRLESVHIALRLLSQFCI